MNKKFLKITAGFTALFFGISLFTAPASFAEKPCWNDGSLTSGSGGTTGSTDVNKGDINKKGKTEVADPIDVSNGNYFYQKEDVSIPSRGMPLKITRIYNSLDIYDGPFGIGWSHNYNIFLMTVSDGAQTYIVRRNADGSKDKFLQNTDGSYTSPPGCYDTLYHEMLPDPVPSGYSCYDKYGTRQVFNSFGKLSCIMDRNDNRIYFEYDPSTGVLLKARDSFGRYITFTYNSNHKITSIRDFTGRAFNYTYDGNGNLVASTAPATQDYPDGLTTSYAYDSKHRVTSITDPKDQRYVALEYYQDDKVSMLTYGMGIYSFSYQSDLTTMTDPKGYKTDYILNADGTVKDMKQYSRYVRSSDPSYYLTSYVYNANRERVKILYPSGSWVKYTYDDKGNCLEIRKKKVGVMDIDDPQNDIVTRFTYEGWYNFIKTMTDPNGHVATYYYDYEEASLGDLNGDGVTNENRGNLVKISYPEVGGQPSEAKFTYNSYGQVVTATDPNANVTKYDYDPDTAYLIKVTRGFGSLNIATEMSYDPAGNVKTVKDPKGNIATFDYDTHNNLIKTTASSPFNYVTNYKYDANDNLMQVDRQTGYVSNPWQTTYYTYNILDKLETIKDDLGNITTFNYDVTGNRSLVRDAELNSTTYEYDERNLLWRITDSLGNVTEYAYDENGNLKEIKDANYNVTDYAYDEFNRLTATNYADGTSEGYLYDNAGNLIRKSTRSYQMISYEYDSLNRITQKTTPESTIEYTYDVGSRLTSVIASQPQAGEAISYTYDSLNRVKTVSYPDNKVVAYDYDGNGNRVKLIYPDLSYITYNHDNLNRLTDIKNSADQVISHYGYDALSRRTGKALLNGTSETYYYDAINRLTDIQGLTQFNYTYDKIANRKTMTTPAGTHNYTYDNIYQLKTADYPAGSSFSDTTFNYDNTGNRTSTVDGGTTNYTPNNLNQYSQIGAITPSYDLNGNLTNIATNTYSYDSENRLIHATSLRGSEATEAIYTYDPFGRRTSKTVNDTITKFLYDGDQVIAEYDGSDNMTAKYVCGDDIDEIISLTNASGTYYYHYDGLGSVTNLTNSIGATVESYAYDVFGSPNTVSMLGNKYAFTGREYDNETGLYHYRERAYSPQIGRFLQTDPLQIDDENLYTYCYNDPVNYVDPYGLLSLPYHGGGDGARGGLYPHPLPGVGGVSLPLPPISVPGGNKLPNPKIDKGITYTGQQGMSEDATNNVNKKEEGQKSGGVRKVLQIAVLLWKLLVGEDDNMDKPEPPKFSNRPNIEYIIGPKRR